MKRSPTALAAAAAGAALLVAALTQQPLWDWLLAWLAAAALWSAAILAALALPERLRPGARASRALAAAWLLLLNPAAAGLTLGAAAWQQRAALDDALDRSPVTTTAAVTALRTRQQPSGGGQLVLYEVTYTWEDAGQTWEATAPAAAQGLRVGAPFGPLRLLPDRPGLHRVGEERLVTGTLQTFTWIMGILTALCLLLLGYVLTASPEPTGAP